MAKQNFLLGKGERLTSDIVVKSGGGQKEAPYTFGEAQGRLTPMIVGFFFTARMAAGAAARLGTMRRTNQVAALTLMGIRPADYLLTPLVFGFCFAMPLITFGAGAKSGLFFSPLRTER